MPMRTTTRTVTFSRPFHVAGIDEEWPAGTYAIETSEEMLEPLSFVAYRRVSTSIQLSQRPGRPGHVETHLIEPEALEAALARDAMAQ